MPTLPTYTSTRNVTPQLREPLRNEASIPFENQQKVLSAVTDAAVQWEDSQNKMEYTDAKVKHDVAIAKIQAEADSDPNFKNSPKYQAAMQQATKESTSGISNPFVLKEAQRNFGYSNQLTGIKIDAGFKQKEIENSRVQFQAGINSLIDQRAGASTTAEALEYERQINEFTDLNYSAGTITYEEAIKSIYAAKVSSATATVFANPDKAIAELQDKNGYYKDIPTATKVKLISAAKTYKRKLALQATALQKDIMYNNETNIVTDLSQGKVISMQQLADMERNGMVDADFSIESQKNTGLLKV